MFYPVAVYSDEIPKTRNETLSAKKLKEQIISNLNEDMHAETENQWIILHKGSHWFIFYLANQNSVEDLKN